MKIARPTLSLVGIMFSIVVVGYVGYRVFALLGPNGVVGALRNEPGINLDIGCGYNPANADQPEYTSPYSSASYQEMIWEQQPLGHNLIPNSDMSQTDKESGEPIGYFRTVENEQTEYSVEAFDGQRFLRVRTTAEVKENEPAAGWIRRFTRIEPNKTYLYGLDYRASEPLEFSVEYFLKDNKVRREHIMTLPKKTTWQRFGAHIQTTPDTIALRFVAASRKPNIVDVRSFDLHQIADAALDTGMISITFDDGWQSAFDHALPLLKMYDFQATHFIMSDVAEAGIAEYMDIGALRKLYDTKQEIGSHSLAHCDLTAFHPTVVRHDLEKSKQSLESNKLGRVMSLAYPYGRFNPAVQEQSAQLFAYARSSEPGYNDRYFDSQSVRAMAVLSTTTEAEFKSWIAHAKEHRQWLVLVYQRVNEHGEYSVPKETLQKHFEIIKQSKLPVQTFTDAANTIRPE